MTKKDTKAPLRSAKKHLNAPRYILWTDESDIQHKTNAAFHKSNITPAPEGQCLAISLCLEVAQTEV